MKYGFMKCFNLVAASAPQEELPQSQRNQAIGILTQLYGCLISAGVCTDYSQAIEDNVFAFNLRFRNELKPYAYMGFKYNPADKSWAFRYRGYSSGPQKDLWALGLEAHREIARLEKRDLIPLLRGFSATPKPAIQLVASR